MRELTKVINNSLSELPEDLSFANESWGSERCKNWGYAKQEHNQWYIYYLKQSDDPNYEYIEFRYDLPLCVGDMLATSYQNGRRDMKHETTGKLKELLGIENE